MSTPITIATTTAARADVDILLIPTTSRSVKDQLTGDSARQIDAELRKRQFTGEWGTLALVPAPRQFKATSIMVVGLGDQETSIRHAEALRRGIGSLVIEARRHSSPKVGIVLAGLSHLTDAAVEAIGLAAYSFVHHSPRLAKRQRPKQLRTAVILLPATQVAAARRLQNRSQQVVAGIDLARDLVNQPANHLAPATLVAEAKRIAALAPEVTVKILNRSQAAKQHFNAFLAVAQGSDTEPYVIHLTYRPKQTTTRSVAIIGKGITFDSGGLSLKPAHYLETMKCDMGGAAAVLGAFQALTSLKPAVTVHGIIATCENMISGKAYRPGDVITAKNGTTIEVLNTDAEGRLTLADALTYAAEQKPDVMIDLATLTGSCVVALGETVAGLWGTSDELMQAVQAAGAAAGEQLETMPMPAEYAALLESSVADLRNIGTNRYGDAIVAAMFLREFVGTIPWAHLDIAGPAYINHPLLSYLQHGATGFGVRTLINYLTK